MPVYPSQRDRRVWRLRQIARKLDDGVDPQFVRHQLLELTTQVEPGELELAKQRLLADGVPIEQIQRLCDLQAAVTHEMVSGVLHETPPGHPAETFHRENAAIRALLAQIRRRIAQLRALPAAAAPRAGQAELHRLTERLGEIDGHYRRKEELLLPCLERRGITGPSRCLWAYHNGIRDRLKAVRAGLATPCSTCTALLEQIDRPLGTLLRKAEYVIVNEQDVLLPLALRTLTAEDWAGIWTESPAYGFSLIEPGDTYRPSERNSVQPHGATTTTLQTPSGGLSAQQLRSILRTLPLDLTFVDEHDRVRFFTDKHDRIFPRSTTALGREVRNCHPPKSLKTVNRILSDFHAGRTDSAEFWLTHHARFVHVQFFALRGEAGEYLGTLEVTQDLTRLRALEGERRLLQYDAPAGSGPQVAER